MRLTSLADYAVVMLTAAARHQGEGWLSATAMAEETGVPLATAQRLSGRLAAAGLLSSTRGSEGGFALARGDQPRRYNRGGRRADRDDLLLRAGPP